MGFVQEFKDFAMRGNVLDMAVGIIIGAAFGLVVTSAVQDVLMPPIGWLSGGIDFKDKVLTLVAPGPDGKGGVVISYGKFLNAVIGFVIQAFAIFIMIKLINRARRQPPPAPAVPPPPTRTEVLLEDIRDTLRANRR